MIYIIIIILNIYFFLLLKKKYIKKKKFRILNNNCKIIKKNIGKGKKVIVVKNFIKLLTKTLNYYFNKIKDKPIEDNSKYPGKRYVTPVELEDEIKNFMILINRKYYKFTGDYNSFEISFSVPDFKLEQYDFIRSVPHQDIYTNPGLAMTLYLCEPNPNYGGTIIYDFKNKETKKEYLQIKSSGYNDNEFNYNFTKRIFKVLHNEELELNKAVIYPCTYWHMANINPKFYKDNKNRVTITAFLTFLDDKYAKNEYENFDSEYEYYFHSNRKNLAKSIFYL